MITYLPTLWLALLAVSCPMGASAQDQNHPPAPRVPREAYAEAPAPDRQEGERPPPPPRNQYRPGRPAPGRVPGPDLFAILDTNHDGVLDEQEIANAAETLRKLDKNGAGRLTPADIRAALPQAHGPSSSPPIDPEQASASVPDDHGRPVAQVAADLGVTPEQFRAAFKKVLPAPRGERPTEAQRQANRIALATALDVAPERLDAVMDKYRPEGPGREWGVKP